MPGTVAIVGASADRTKFGNKAVRAYLKQGWTVYPVNPRGGQIEGQTAFSRVEQVPGPVDRVLLYVPPELGLRLLPAIAALQPAELYVNPGADSPDLIAAAEKLGLTPILACAVLAIGETPASFA
jgi:predicted CoA-binding protein